jgi:hypothetical protein
MGGTCIFFRTLLLLLPQDGTWNFSRRICECCLQLGEFHRRTEKLCIELPGRTKLQTLFLWTFHEVFHSLHSLMKPHGMFCYLLKSFKLSWAFTRLYIFLNLFSLSVFYGLVKSRDPYSHFWHQVHLNSWRYKS